jgi:hypothetical protein
MCTTIHVFRARTRHFFLFSGRMVKDFSRDMQKIESLPHQRAIIDHLVASCPRQHGLLVAHQMGTGKTLTALMFLNNFPKSRHVILCPVFLKDLYDRESLRLLGKPLGKSEIIAYSELEGQLRSNPDLLENAVVVMDEAHYLLELFHGMEFQTLYTLRNPIF